MAEAALILDCVRQARSRSRPARCSISGRQRSTILCAPFGGFWPVSRSRTIIATRLFERRLGALRHVGETALLEAILEHGVEILRDALHPARADRFDARLFHRLEDGAGGGACGSRRRCTSASWQASRSAMESAWPRRIAASCAAELARRLRQPRLRRRAAAAQIGFFRRIGDFELRHMRERAHAAGDGALEGLLRRFHLRRRLLVRPGHGVSLVSLIISSEKFVTFRNQFQLIATFTALSGSSWPKQR